MPGISEEVAVSSSKKHIGRCKLQGYDSIPFWWCACWRLRFNLDPQSASKLQEAAGHLKQAKVSTRCHSPSSTAIANDHLILRTGRRSKSKATGGTRTRATGTVVVENKVIDGQFQRFVDWNVFGVSNYKGSATRQQKSIRKRYAFHSSFASAWSAVLSSASLAAPPPSPFLLRKYSSYSGVFGKSEAPS